MIMCSCSYSGVRRGMVVRIAVRGIEDRIPGVSRILGGLNEVWGELWFGSDVFRFRGEKRSV
jgi:hypothetical protein